jgi:hypothetical protein
VSDYDGDVVLWSEQQGALLRRIAAGEPVNVAPDWMNIAEEIETVGRSERVALASHVLVIIEHLIKLQASPAAAPRAGWEDTIDRARAEVGAVLEASPSLRPALSTVLEKQMPRARRLAARAMARHGEQPRVDPQSLSFAADRVAGDWWP